jgi:hypothetical protein
VVGRLRGTLAGTPIEFMADGDRASFSVAPSIRAFTALVRTQRTAAPIIRARSLNFPISLKVGPMTLRTIRV